MYPPILLIVSGVGNTENSGNVKPSVFFCKAQSFVRLTSHNACVGVEAHQDGDLLEAGTVTSSLWSSSPLIHVGKS